MSTDTNVYTHAGVVSRIEGSSVVVSLDRNIHCASCQAKGACGISDSANKEIEIFNPGASYALSEPVTVILKKDLGQKAVFWAYIFPFLLVMLTLLTTSFFVSEWIAGLLSLSVLIPYYALIYAGKRYFKSTFSISIAKLA
jgi:positive regulator of sigma E activity